jgi:hypothetical protein
MVNRSIAVLLGTAALFAFPVEASAQCTGQPPGNRVCASPNGAAGLPLFRLLVPADIPSAIVAPAVGPVNAIQGTDGSGHFTGTADATVLNGSLALGRAGISNGILSLSDATGGQTNLRPTNGTNGTIRLPNGTDTLVALAITQTLTNKTIDTAGPNTIKIAGTTIAGAVGNSGNVHFAVGPLTSGNFLKADANSNAVDGGVTTGTSGATIPLNNGNNNFSGSNTFSGATNFTSTFQVAGFTMTWPGNNATLPQLVARGTVALGTASINSGACAGAIAGTASAGNVANILATDTINVSFNGDPTGVVGYQPATTGMLSIIPYPTAGASNFKVCNNTNSAITPGAITLNWQVLR